MHPPTNPPPETSHSHSCTAPLPRHNRPRITSKANHRRTQNPPRPRRDHLPPSSPLIPPIEKPTMTTPGNRGPATDTESITNPTAPNRTRILHRYTKMMDTTKHRPNCKIIPNEPNRCQAMKYAPRTNSSKGIILAKPIRSINESPPVKMESTSTRNNSTDKARKYTEPPSVLMTQSQPRRTQQKINLRGTESTNQKHRDKNQPPPKHDCKMTRIVIIASLR